MNDPARDDEPERRLAGRRGRGIALILCGVMLPPVAFVATGMLVTPPQGMDGYVPAFLGGMAGAVVGAGLLIAGVVVLLRAHLTVSDATSAR